MKTQFLTFLNETVNGIKWAEDNIDSVKEIFSADFKETPAGKYYSTKQEFLTSTDAETGAMGDLVFMAWFDGSKKYVLLALQVDKATITAAFNKMLKGIMNDEDNPQLVEPFKEWFKYDFVPLHNKIHKK